MEVVDRNALYQSIHGIVSVLDKMERLKLLLYIQSITVRIYQHSDGSRINLSGQSIENLKLIKVYARSLIIPLTNTID